jgi:hypothetical protein
MSADSLPVVAAWVWTDEDGQPFFRMQWSDAEPDDRPALAVPDALWDDAEFRHAVAGRAKTRATTGAPTLLELLLAIHAELLARAGEAA